MNIVLTANLKGGIDPLQEELARLETKATTLRRKLAHVPFYRELLQAEKEIRRVHREIDKEAKSKRKNIVEDNKKQVLFLGNGKP